MKFKNECDALAAKHRAAKYIKHIKNKKIYGWFLKNAVAFEKAIPYHHPPGAQIWVVLS